MYPSPYLLGDDSGPAPLPMGNGRAMIGQSNWQFSKNDLQSSSAIPGSDT
jgi:hypothetical protein